MPSPFPGMNPYLEQPSVWQDFHQSLVTRIRDASAGQVRPQFFVKIEESIFIHEPSAEERRHVISRADVAVVTDPRLRSTTIAEQIVNPDSALIATLPGIETERHSFIEIRDRDHREPVTMIEVLSPSSKRYGPDREQYLIKRTSLLASRASLVEIDLLRQGSRLPMTGVPDCDYVVMVSRPELRPDAQVWAIGLRDPLPPIPIPLRDSIPDATLNLQELLHDVYDAAGYEDYLYETSPVPLVTDLDSAWAQCIAANPTQFQGELQKQCS